jgi:hypothetical protein
MEDSVKTLFEKKSILDGWTFKTRIECKTNGLGSGIPDIIRARKGAVEFWETKVSQKKDYHIKKLLSPSQQLFFKTYPEEANVLVFIIETNTFERYHITDVVRYLSNSYIGKYTRGDPYEIREQK